MNKKLLAIIFSFSLIFTGCAKESKTSEDTNTSGEISVNEDEYDFSEVIYTYPETYINDDGEVISVNTPMNLTKENVTKEYNALKEELETLDLENVFNGFEISSEYYIKVMDLEDTLRDIHDRFLHVSSCLTINQKIEIALNKKYSDSVLSLINSLKNLTVISYSDAYYDKLEEYYSTMQDDTEIVEDEIKPSNEDILVEFINEERIQQEYDILKVEVDSFKSSLDDGSYKENLIKQKESIEIKKENN